jgi:rhodanese-related sulfurtransferase
MKLFTDKGRRFPFIPALFFLCILSVHNSYLWSAESNDTAVSVKPQQKSTGGYCGIYCLYGAMKFLGRDCDPNGLIKQEYIGAPAGSSLAELKKCAEDYGLYATPVKRLSTKDLRGLSPPVIIHVKSYLTARVYDHYELFLGTRQDKALIYDPPRPIELTPFRTLAPRWDGSALIISDKPIDLGALTAPTRRRFAVYTVITIAVVLTLRWVRKHFFGISRVMNRKKALLLSLGQCTAIILTAGAGAFVYHSTNEEGLLAYREATASVQRAHSANFINKISTNRARRLHDGREAIFIDPRSDFAFNASHLKDAISIPPYATDDDRINITGQIDKNALIIVYCQKTDYRLAGILATKLLSDGFSNVQIYKGNWVQWPTSKKTD